MEDIEPRKADPNSIQGILQKDISLYHFLEAANRNQISRMDKQRQCNMFAPPGRSQVNGKMFNVANPPTLKSDPFACLADQVSATKDMGTVCGRPFSEL